MTSARAAAQHFLDRYVDGDGRVVRRDQGGDTVSEGQAYALLLGVALDDRRAVQRVWRWTATHLQRPDGALAWRWQDGRVVDSELASDADIDAAHALVLGGERWGDDGMRDAGRRLATAVLDGATVETDAGTVLVAGGWARDEPAIVNPSYLSPSGFVALASATSDERWRSVAATGRRLLAGLVEHRPHLPPDWAETSGDGATPRPAPGGEGAATYGLDAARTLVRHAHSCDPADRGLAARAWPFLREQADDELVAVYHLEGSPASGYRHPLALVAAAASAAAAGDDAAMERLLRRAERLEAQHPSYYGAAWVALGRVLLATDALGGCGT